MRYEIILKVGSLVVTTGCYIEAENKDEAVDMVIEAADVEEA